MTDQIRAALTQVEQSHNVRIILAVESGSRAWGFASPDSDYDVRFVYVHREDHYLSIEPHRDVIEAMLPHDIDLVGWDLPKALRLLRKSNPSLLEWIGSPIVYQQNDNLLLPLKDLADQYASLERSHYHYVNMAEGNFRNYFDRPTINYKKYLYVLRPLLACRYLEEFKSTPPVLFTELVETTLKSRSIKAAIDELLTLKSASSELAEGPPIPELHNFVTEELPRQKARKPSPKKLGPIEPLNDYFRAAIKTKKT